jgi:hypothetical protein
MDRGFVTTIFLLLNFLPTIVSYCRRHRNRLPITLINTLLFTLGWIAVFVAPASGLILGPIWLVALIWACTANVEPNVRAIGLDTVEVALRLPGGNSRD